jgi:tRNA pseudouridine55 synthase
MATGLLICAANEATKFIPYFTPDLPACTRVRKEYVFEVAFGQSTDSYDAEGSVTGVSTHFPRAEHLAEICKSMIGRQQQCPPIFSAIKHGGRRLCDMARRGECITPLPREIFIHSLELVHCVEDNGVRSATFKASVSGGTYVRSLAHDISLKAGTLGHVTSLRRTKDGPFDISQAISLEKLVNLAHKEDISSFLVPVGAVLGDIPAVSVSERDFDGAVCGRAFSVAEPSFESLSDSTFVRIMFGGTFLGVGWLESGVCYPRRLLSFP